MDTCHRSPGTQQRTGDNPDDSLRPPAPLQEAITSVQIAVQPEGALDGDSDPGVYRSHVGGSAGVGQAGKGLLRI
jgi:hypothetical protein